MVFATYFTQAYYKPGGGYEFFGEFPRMVNSLGKGKVNLDMFWDGSLFQARDLLPALEKGSYDLMLLPDSYCSGSWIDCC